MNEAEFNVFKWLLKQMENIKTHPGRNSYCADFDNVYAQRKEIYKKHTGKEWEG
jgi:hypothetical protein